MSKAKELAEQMFPEPQMENDDEFEAYFEIYNKEYSKGEYCHETSFKWGFEEGSRWKREQMKKDAIDARVLAIGHNAIVREENEDNLRKYLLSKFHNGDKVKVIIIKE